MHVSFLFFSSLSCICPKQMQPTSQGRHSCITNKYSHGVGQRHENTHIPTHTLMTLSMFSAWLFPHLWLCLYRDHRRCTLSRGQSNKFGHLTTYAQSALWSTLFYFFFLLSISLSASSLCFFLPHMIILDSWIGVDSFTVRWCWIRCYTCAELTNG